MASGKSAYLEAALLDHIFGATLWTPPAKIWFALAFAAFDPDLTGADLTEPNPAASYTRIGLNNTTANFDDAIGSAPAQKLTAADIVFPAATGEWGLIAAIYACDAATDGNILYGADLPVKVPVTTGSGFSVPAGSGIFTEN